MKNITMKKKIMKEIARWKWKMENGFHFPRKMRSSRVRVSRRTENFMFSNEVENRRWWSSFGGASSIRERERV